MTGKWGKFLTLLCLLAASLAFAQDLKTAEEYYRQGKFSDALQTYENILKNKPNDPFVYYNIGNCYFKMGSTGLAVANYYRAFKLAPRDADIRNNLSLAMAGAGEKLVPGGVPEGLHKAFYWFSYNELKGLTFLALWLFCTLAAVWLVKRRFGRMSVAALGVLCILAGWTYIRWQGEKENLAVIAAPIAEIRSGPGTNFPASASIAQGHLVTVQDAKDAWYEVVVKSQGIKGWVDSGAVEKI